MQVFLPFPDIKTSILVLDKVRKWKQVLEAKQLIDVVDGRKQGWKNHPCAKMYSKYPNFLKLYYNTALDLWKKVGKTKLEPVELGLVVLPPWIGNEEFHKSHQSNLLRKAEDDRCGISRLGNKKPSRELLNNLELYGISTINTPTNLEYVWPDA